MTWIVDKLTKLPHYHFLARFRPSQFRDADGFLQAIKDRHLLRRGAKPHTPRKHSGTAMLAQVEGHTPSMRDFVFPGMAAELVP